MKQQEVSQFKQEVDAWIKGFKKDLDIYSEEMDDVGEDVRSHNEELQFQFENLCRIESRIDRLEDTFERLLEMMETQSNHSAQFREDKLSNMQMLKDKF